MHNQGLERTYQQALATEASIDGAIVVALNRLSSAIVDKSELGSSLQKATLYTLDGELVSQIGVSTQAGRAIAAKLRRAGVHGRINRKALLATRAALLSGNSGRFPLGLAKLLSAQHISPAHFSAVLRQVVGNAKVPKKLNALSPYTNAQPTAPLISMYQQLGPSSVAAIVSSLTKTGALTRTLALALSRQIDDASAATTMSSRESAMGAFHADLNALRPGALRTFLTTAAAGLVGSDGYRLDVKYSVNGKAAETIFPVPLAT